MTEQPDTPDLFPAPDDITLEMLANAEQVIGLHFTPSERELMHENVQDHRAQFAALRSVALDNSVPPACAFDPRLPGMAFDTIRQPLAISAQDVPPLPADLDGVAFWPVTHLAHLILTRQITSVTLTELYIRRLKQHDPALHCVVTLLEDRALEQARRADDELARGHYRGPLHGIPWGAKDLLAVRGYPTTWGAAPYKDQVLDVDATVVERLDAAGAVLVAKLTMGALAWGDFWFGGQTRNPWNTAEGSSGSSAGSAAATAAGLIGFAIGTETYGSIVSPCTRCRVTGLRPTFGRVSRHGAMALSWSMDKIGPIARTVEDCALVFDAIYGPDGKDLTVTDYPFNWPPDRALGDLRVGYVPEAFEVGEDRDAFAALSSLGLKLVPIALPDFPDMVFDAVVTVLEMEAAAAFDDLTRSNRDDLLTRQVKDAWPNVFRAARLMPAVEYIQANRVRTLMMRSMAALMDEIDVYVLPSFRGHSLLLTNLTGHPAVVVPNGVNESNEPSSLTFTGRLYGEAAALAVAKAYQDATGFHHRHPRTPA